MTFCGNATELQLYATPVTNLLQEKFSDPKQAHSHESRARDHEPDSRGRFTEGTKGVAEDTELVALGKRGMSNLSMDTTQTQHAELEEGDGAEAQAERMQMKEDHGGIGEDEGTCKRARVSSLLSSGMAGVGAPGSRQTGTHQGG